jgi:hypothetical protein
MEPFTVLVRDGSHIFREKIQVELQEMEFQRHVAPEGTVWGKQLLDVFYVFLWYIISQNVVAYILKRVSSSSLCSIQFIFEVGVLKKLFYLRTEENAFSYLGLAYAWKFSP